MSLPKIIDNNRRVLKDTLDQLCENYDEISIATGYWDLPGTQLLIDKLENFKKIRLLIGQEPLAPRYKKSNPEIDFPDQDIFSDLEMLEQTSSYKDLIVRIRTLIEEDKLEVKIYKKTFFHAKAYIFGNYGSNENVAIIGSSNFTRAGLTGNTELNSVEADGRIITSMPKTETQEIGHLFWFDQFWNEAEEWTGEFSRLLSTSTVGDQMFSPYEMYIATLYQLYKEELEDDDVLNRENSLYEFQRRNANLLIKKLKNYRLAMLSDSVGLGKTYTAGSVIDHYIHSPEGRQRVEIIVPASLKNQWTSELSKGFGLTDVSIISLHNEDEINRRRQIDKDAQVRLFVIDEAHNLRSENGARYKMMFDWLAANPNSHVLMLTATPINNQLSDFANQIQLAAKGSRSAYKILYTPNEEKEPPRSRDFDEVIRSLDASIKAQAKQGKTINFNKVKKALRPALSHFMVRATRQGIEATYGGLKDSEGNLKQFPQGIVDSLPYDFTSVQAEKIRDVLSAFNGTLPITKIFAYSLEELLEKTQRSSHPLRSLEKPMIDEDALPTNSPFDMIFQLVLSLGLPLYRDMLYQHRFYDKTVEELRAYKLEGSDGFRLRIQMSIHNIIRIGYLKRLESSPQSLDISIRRYRDRLLTFRDALDQGKLITIKDIDTIRKEFSDDDTEIVFDTDEESSDISERTHNIAELKADIEFDLKIIDCALQCVRILTDEDKKLEAFAAHLSNLRNTQPAGKKVLIFSFYADTIEYLKKRIPQLTGNAINHENAAFITGHNKKLVENYTGRFAPIAKHYEMGPLDTELDYLFSTDVLSEGQNLQDCGVLINYDLHWNPVRMIQRNGRINRLGSLHKNVYIYNMHPQHQLEQYLRLVERLQHKVDLIRNTVGTDQSILGEKAKPVDFLDDAANDLDIDATLKLLTGDEQLRQQAMTALEEEADFSLGEDGYIADLRRFDTESDLETKRRVYHGIPKRKWGMLPAKTVVNKNVPDALTLVRFDVKNAENKESVEVIGGHQRFYASQPRAGTMQLFDTLAALSYMQTTAEDNHPIRDAIEFDKEAVEARISRYGQMLATSEYESPRDSKMKPSYTQVLDYLVTNLGIDTTDIFNALTRGTNRVYEKQLENGMRKAYDRIKQNKPLTDADLLLITEPTKYLMEASTKQHILENMEIVYNYAKPN